MRNAMAVPTCRCFPEAAALPTSRAGAAPSVGFAPGRPFDDEGQKLPKVVPRTTTAASASRGMTTATTKMST